MPRPRANLMLKGGRGGFDLLVGAASFFFVIAIGFAADRGYLALNRYLLRYREA